MTFKNLSYRIGNESVTPCKIQIAVKAHPQPE